MRCTHSGLISYPSVCPGVQISVGENDVAGCGQGWTQGEIIRDRNTGGDINGSVSSHSSSIVLCFLKELKLKFTLDLKRSPPDIIIKQRQQVLANQSHSRVGHDFPACSVINIYSSVPNKCLFSKSTSAYGNGRKKTKVSIFLLCTVVTKRLSQSLVLRNLSFTLSSKVLRAVFKSEHTPQFITVST